MIIDFSNREFQPWFYSVNHSELHIRSTTYPNHSKNIDLMFFGVKYIELTGIMHNLKIEHAVESDIAYIKKRINEFVKVEEITILSSDEGRYMVVASLLHIYENKLDIMELPESFILTKLRQINDFDD